MFEPHVYSKRRRELSAGTGLALLMGNEQSPMNYTDNYYPFRQDSTFLYYFGHDQAGLAATIDLDSGLSTLYAPTPTMDDVIWSGPQRSPQEMAQACGADRVHAPDRLPGALNAARTAGRTIHFLPPYRADTRTALNDLLGADAQPSHALIHAVIAQRSVKEPRELNEIESALTTTHAMYAMAMRATRVGMRESTLAGKAEGLAIGGGGRLAFPCICTRRGEVLHNHSYDGLLERADLVLLDCGASSRRGYASDITRTFPVEAPFNERQRAVYEAVLDAASAALETIRPGVPFKISHMAAARSLTRSLQAMGIMKGDVEESVAKGAHALFFPHGLGHMMGLDVHDMEGFGEDHVGYDSAIERADQFGTRSLRMGRAVAPGYVLTVEPGCYFIDALIDQWQAARKHRAFIEYGALTQWKGLGGVRIEDDIVVTSDGYRLLGPPIPKSIADVEAACDG